MSQGLIYLASPYSNSDPAVKQFRYEAACRAVAAMMKEGQLVYSPIVYGHRLHTDYGIGGEFKHWEFMDRAIISSGLILIMTVLRLPGDQDSHGIAEELRLAESLKIPIRFREPD